MIRRRLALLLAPDLAAVLVDCQDALDALERDGVTMDDLREARASLVDAITLLRGGPPPLPLPPQQP